MLARGSFSFFLSAALLAAERVGLLILALLWTRGQGPIELVLATAVLSVAYWARAAVTARRRSWIEGHLWTEAIRGVYRGNVLLRDDVDVQTILSEGVDAEARTVAETKPALAGDTVAAIASAVWALLTWTRSSAAIALVSIGFGFTVGALARRVALRATAETWRHYEEVLRKSIEAVTGRVEVVAMAREAEALARVQSTVATMLASARRSGWTAALAGRAPFALAMVVAIAANHWVNPSMTLVTSVLVVSVLPPFAGIGLVAMDLARSSPARSNLGRLLATRESGLGHRRIEGRPRVVRCSQLSATYADGVPALRELSLVWDVSRVLVLAGPNGSGKSTWLRLVAGLVSPSEGAIYADDIDFEDIDMNAWRCNVAYLPQSPYLPAQSTVRECVHFLEPYAGDEEILAALERVGLLEALRGKTKHVLDAIVDRLSSGERQRLALARLLVRNAHLYLLDEPDQNLDSKGRAMVVSLIEDLSRTASVAVAAHDSEVAHVAGHHVELRGGRIAEDRIIESRGEDIVQSPARA